MPIARPNVTLLYHVALNDGTGSKHEGCSEFGEIPPNSSYYIVFTNFTVGRRHGRRDACVYLVTLVWPWPWPHDLDTWLWPRNYEEVFAYKMNFLGRCFQKFESEREKQTDRQTNATQRINSRINNKKLSLSNRRDSARCGWNGHSRSLKVIRCCANRGGIYDFLLALNSNLTSIFNRSWDITPSLHIHTLPLPGGTGKRRLGASGHALVSGCPEHWTIQP